jgi:hypothetical protein
VLHYTRLERLAADKHSSLLSPFVSYKENKVFWIGSQIPQPGTGRRKMTKIPLENVNEIIKSADPFKDG